MKDEVVLRGPRGKSTVDAKQQQLLAAVLADPSDDVPRQVYADFLLERGAPRGEFITVQLALARRQDTELKARSDALLKKHQPEWVGRFAGTQMKLTIGQKSWNRGSPTKWTFARGFVDTVSMQSADLIANSRELFAVEPVREVRITDRDVKGLVTRCHAIERLRSLDLHKIPLKDDHAAALFGGKNLTSLETLNLSGGRLSMRALRTGLKAWKKGCLPKLRALKLGGNRLGDAMVAELARTGLAHQLTELDLTDTQVGTQAAAAVAALPLEQLRLRFNPLGPEGIRALARSKTLRALEVPYTDGGEGLLELVQVKSLQSLEIDDKIDAGITEKLKARFADGLLIS
jgi:uncharacterized protein (TIGR02996 family)